MWDKYWSFCNNDIPFRRFHSLLSIFLFSWLVLFIKITTTHGFPTVGSVVVRQTTSQRHIHNYYCNDKKHPSIVLFPSCSKSNHGSSNLRFPPPYYYSKTRNIATRFTLFATLNNNYKNNDENSDNLGEQHFKNNEQQNPLSSLNTAAILRKIQNIQQRLIPPIPYQEEQEQEQQISLLSSWKRHFTCRFAVKEFLYGAKYMCRIHWLLMAGSVIARMIIFKCLNYNQLEGILSPRIDYCPLHTIESRFKNIYWFLVHTMLPREADSFMTSISYWVAGPIAEELSYRGIGHACSRFESRVLLWMISMLSRGHFLFGILFYAAMLLEFPLMATILVLFNNKSQYTKPTDLFFSMNWIGQLSIWIGQLFLFPAVYQIYDAAYNFQNKYTTKQPTNQTTTKTMTTTTTTRTTITVPGASRGRLPWRAICRLDRLSSSPAPQGAPQQKLNLSSPQVVNKFHRCISQRARWSGACRFGQAHYRINPSESLSSSSLSPSANWIPESFFPSTNVAATVTSINNKAPWHFLIDAQKCLGTLTSSLLVESRLAVNRGTLWGCFGAHMAFNIIAEAKTLTYLFAFTNPTVGILFSNPWHKILFSCSLVLWIHKIILDAIAKVLEMIEKCLLS